MLHVWVEVPLRLHRCVGHVINAPHVAQVGPRELEELSTQVVLLRPELDGILALIGVCE